MTSRAETNYAKPLLLIATLIAAYFIFHDRNLEPFRSILLSLGYLGTFIAGVLYVYGFTAGPATAIFLILAEEQDIILASLVGGLGSVAGDLLVFNAVRRSLKVKLAQPKQGPFQHSAKEASPWKKPWLLLLGSFIIASPLPDELGVGLLAGATKISEKTFTRLAYLLNTAGILLILTIGKAL